MAKRSVLGAYFNTARATDGGTGWRRIPLGEIAEIQTGLALGKDYAGSELGEFPYLRVANVQDGHLELSEVKYVRIPVEDADSYRLQVGDVLLNEGGDSDKLGRGTVWRGEIQGCLHQNHVFCVRPNQELLSSEFLTYQTASPYGKAYFLRCAKKTTNLASINTKQVKAFPLLVPLDRAEQDRIAQQLTALDARIAEVTKQFAQATWLQKHLVSHLLTPKAPS